MYEPESVGWVGWGRLVKAGPGISEAAEIGGAAVDAVVVVAAAVAGPQTAAVAALATGVSEFVCMLQQTRE